MRKIVERWGAAAVALVAVILFAAARAFAQDAPPAPIVDWSDIVQKILALPAIVAAVLAVLKHGVSFIPNRFLPIIGAVVALLADVFAQLATSTDLTPVPSGIGSAVAAVVLGAGATGLHQTRAAPRTAKQIEELEAELERARRERPLR